MVTLTKFEQSAFVLTADDISIAVDFGAYSNEPSLTTIGQPAASLVSHIHGDHCSADNLVRLGAPVYTVREVAESLKESGLQVRVHSVGDRIQIENTPFELQVVASDHGPFVGPVENSGFLIKGPQASVYFLGDMAVSTPPPVDAYDIVLVPVGNNNYTFGPEEAFKHLQSIKWQGLTVPIHYSGQLNPATCEEFVRLAADSMDVRVLGIGESLTFP